MIFEKCPKSCTPIVPLLRTQQLQPSRNCLEIQEECWEELKYSHTLSEHVDGSSLTVSMGRTPTEENNTSPTKFKVFLKITFFIIAAPFVSIINFYVRNSYLGVGNNNFANVVIFYWNLHHFFYRQKSWLCHTHPLQQQIQQQNQLCKLFHHNVNNNVPILFCSSKSTFVYSIHQGLHIHIYELFMFSEFLV